MGEGIKTQIVIVITGVFHLANEIWPDMMTADQEELALKLLLTLAAMFFTMKVQRYLKPKEIINEPSNQNPT